MAGDDAEYEGCLAQYLAIECVWSVVFCFDDNRINSTIPWLVGTASNDLHLPVCRLP